MFTKKTIAGEEKHTIIVSTKISKTSNAQLEEYIKMDF